MPHLGVVQTTDEPLKSVLAVLPWRDTSASSGARPGKQQDLLNYQASTRGLIHGRPSHTEPTGSMERPWGVDDGHVSR